MKERLLRDASLYGEAFVRCTWDKEGNASIAPIPFENVILTNQAKLMDPAIRSNPELFRETLNQIEQQYIIDWSHIDGLGSSNGGPNMYNEPTDPIGILEDGIAGEQGKIDNAMQNIKTARTRINMAEEEISQAEKRKRVLQDAVDKLKR